MVERVNRTITDVASMITKGESTNWAEHVGEIEYAMNTRVSSVTKFSPNELVYGRLPPGPVYIDAFPNVVEGSEEDKLTSLKRRIRTLQQLAHENQMEAAESQRTFHDTYVDKHTFHKGDDVWVYMKRSTEKGKTSKLVYRWKGPYTISEELGPVTFILKDKEGKQLPGTFHAEQLYKP